MRTPSPPIKYILAGPLAGSSALLKGAEWMLGQILTDPWKATIWNYVALPSLLVIVGFFISDIFNPRSWVRNKLRMLRHVFEIQGVRIIGADDCNLVIDVRARKAITDVQISIEYFYVNSERLAKEGHTNVLFRAASFVKNESKRILIAQFPSTTREYGRWFTEDEKLGGTIMPGGKVIAYLVLAQRCGTQEYAFRLDVDVDKHPCSKVLLTTEDDYAPSPR